MIHVGFLEIYIPQANVALLKSLRRYYSFIFMSSFLLIGKHYIINIKRYRW